MGTRMRRWLAVGVMGAMLGATLLTGAGSVAADDETPAALPAAPGMVGPLAGNDGSDNDISGDDTFPSPDTDTDTGG